MLEKELYEPVAAFIRKEFGCFDVSIQAGTDYGTIDIVGLRYSMDRYGGSTEIVAVEVKRGLRASLKSLGQAVGYSVMADRCYLAVRKENGARLTSAERVSTYLQPRLRGQWSRGRTRNNAFDFRLSGPL